MKAGKIVGKFKTKEGREILIRYMNFTDYEQCLHFVNSLIKEGAMIGWHKKFSKKEEIELICNQLKRMENNEVIVLVAEIDKNIVGIADVGKRKGREEHVGTFGISIKKKFRKLGIGEILAKKVLELAKKELKIKIVILDVFENNIPAINLYKKLGFRIYGKLPKGVKYKDRYVTKICMYKEL